MENAGNTSKEGWDWRTHIPNNVHIVYTGLNTDFFRKWCNVMRLLIPMTDKELNVVAAFLKQRWELSKIIYDPSVLDAQLMSDSVRDKIMEECDITRSYFHVLKSGLKAKNIIIGNRLNPKLIPNVQKSDHGVFQFLMLFKDTDYSEEPVEEGHTEDGV